MRCVVDTNVLVSAIVFPLSVPRQAVDKALSDGVLLFSDFTLDELKEVLFRSKFDRYVSREERALFLAQIGVAAEFVHIIQVVRECRDQNDDKFLEVALNGRADVIITGDADLLAMSPWRDVAIATPATYLEGKG
ncbi:Nucleotide binding protein PINc [Candidatus Sulfotelmatobacter kueseliae]|uniref:Nucleotide binding protein PINc n=1 Tax=Candidatus Sulfotelmatobacter kueseliae TaxID=2042962 RepID=A0A2U3KRH9_9BACT|nr:Nucleotide binding protein PINc [Candidatus Sulfotelmatobacter kueseliae]